MLCLETCLGRLYSTFALSIPSSISAKVKINLLDQMNLRKQNKNGKEQEEQNGPRSKAQRQIEKKNACSKDESLALRMKNERNMYIRIWIGVKLANEFVFFYCYVYIIESAKPSLF